jgi:hypothetical protein
LRLIRYRCLRYGITIETLGSAFAVAAGVPPPYSLSLKQPSIDGVDERPVEDDEIPMHIIVAAQDMRRQLEKERLIDWLADRQYPAEDPEVIPESFGKNHVDRSQATYLMGLRISEVREGVYKPRVGIILMRGGSLVQVNMQEQLSMTQKAPDQLDSRWRVNTAGTLLFKLEFDHNLSVSHIDITQSVIANARRRQGLEESRSSMQKVVTIDSSNVMIVDSFDGDKWDLEATLIEVDQSSLAALIVGCRALFSQSGPSLTETRTVSLSCND